MGNWTDRFDPETVDEIKRCEVGEGDFLLAERLAMHKGVESVFGFHVMYEHNSIFHALSDGRTCAGYHWQYLDE